MHEISLLRISCYSVLMLTVLREPNRIESYQIQKHICDIGKNSAISHIDCNGFYVNIRKHVVTFYKLLITVSLIPFLSMRKAFFANSCFRVG